MKILIPRFLATVSALALLSTGPARAESGEPLPAGAPTTPYELSAWCYGAMSEYLDIYDRVKPDLRAIDKLFGSSVKDEVDPYADDVAAAREEAKVLAGAVEGAEKASAQVIAPRGADAVKAGRAIWGPAETRTSRELARAWMSWALPDQCDTTARDLTAKSALLGQALKYNTPAPAAEPDAPPPPPEPSPTPPAPPADPKG